MQKETGAISQLDYMSALTSLTVAKQVREVHRLQLLATQYRIKNIYGLPIVTR